MPGWLAEFIVVLGSGALFLTICVALTGALAGVVVLVRSALVRPRPARGVLPAFSPPAQPPAPASIPQGAAGEPEQVGQ